MRNWFSLPFSLSPQLSVVALCTLFLAACSSVPRQAEPVLALNEREQQLSAMTTFTVQASLGIRTPDDSISGNLRWQQHSPTAFDAQMRNFLGISLFELKDDARGSAISLKGETYYAVDTSSLLLQLAGWSVPLTDMPLWLRGLPGRNARDIVRDDAGRVVAFSLTDSTGIVWQLQYQAFFPDSLSLPKRMLLSSSDTQIKLVIRNWQ